MLCLCLNSHEPSKATDFIFRGLCISWALTTWCIFSLARSASIVDKSVLPASHFPSLISGKLEMQFMFYWFEITCLIIIYCKSC